MQEPERFTSPAYLNVLDDQPSKQHCAINAESMRLMRDSAEAGYPMEICGLLIGNITDAGWVVQQARPVRNLNTRRASDRFQLDPDAYQAIDRELRGTGREIIGVFHSHPDCPARPSPTDLENVWEGFAYPIISVYKSQAADIRCWAVNAGGSKFQAVTILEAE